MYYTVRIPVEISNYLEYSKKGLIQILIEYN